MSSSPQSMWDFPKSSRKIFPLVALISWFSPLPIVNWLAGTSPWGNLSRFLVTLLVQGVSYVSGSDVVQNDPKKLVVGLTAFYIICVYILSSIMSVWAQILGNRDGYRNKEPRPAKRLIVHGLPSRMIATHEALYDIFPAYAVTAALVAVCLSSTTHRGSAFDYPLNALTLHVFIKLFVYVPAYLMQVDGLRSFSHFSSVSALLVALWGAVKL